MSTLSIQEDVRQKLNALLVSVNFINNRYEVMLPSGKYKEVTQKEYEVLPAPKRRIVIIEEK